MHLTSTLKIDHSQWSFYLSHKRMWLLLMHLLFCFFSLSALYWLAHRYTCKNIAYARVVCCLRHYDLTINCWKSTIQLSQCSVCQFSLFESMNREDRPLITDELVKLEKTNDSFQGITEYSTTEQRKNEHVNTKQACLGNTRISTNYAQISSQTLIWMPVDLRY